MKINDRVYGEQEITDPLAIELLETPAMQRLKKVHQGGVFHLFNPDWNNTRWEHSIGVYLLLKQYDAPREECIAGLLHDIGHMAFSHVIDYVFERYVEQDTGDNATVTYVKEQTKIPEILAKYEMTVEQVFDESRYPMLERDLPDLCADRIDYSLRDGIVFGLMNQETAQEYLSHLHVVDNTWVFDDYDTARAYAEDVMMMVESFWTSPWQVFDYHIAVAAIRLALEQNVITEEDFWLTDDEVLEKMKQGDEHVQALIHQLHNIDAKQIMEAEGEGEITSQRKCRVQDPLFQRDGALVRVSKAAPDFKEDWDRLAEEFAREVRFPEWLLAKPGS